MSKKLTFGQEAVLMVVKKHFRKGQVLSYKEIGDHVGVSAETARRTVISLGGKIKRKNGHIVGVK